MGREAITPLPALQRRLQEVGENLRLARLRRRLHAGQVAERAGLSRTTLRAVERGDPSVSFGAYANVLFTLGLDKDLEALGRDDELGRKLQDAQIPVGSRAPRRSAQSAQATPRQGHSQPQGHSQEDGSIQEDDSIGVTTMLSGNG